MRTHAWKLKSRTLEWKDRPLVMGILNVTPDSFSDGGAYLDPEAALDRALELEAEGADLLDLGGESTRPGADLITAETELARILPVLRKLRGRLGIPLSIDTWKAQVAQAALGEGAEIINDVSAGRWDPALWPVGGGARRGLCADARAGPSRHHAGRAAVSRPGGGHRRFPGEIPGPRGGKRPRAGIDGLRSRLRLWQDGHS